MDLHFLEVSKALTLSPILYALVIPCHRFVSFGQATKLRGKASCLLNYFLGFGLVADLEKFRGFYWLLLYKKISGPVQVGSGRSYLRKLKKIKFKSFIR